MNSIWVTEIVFKPAGALTFRQMPSGLLHIMSYPFMPPTTMSGFLQRLLRISHGERKEWPGYGEEWFKGPLSKGFTLTLDSKYRALGAFPEPESWSIHKTRRHGPKDFKHKVFSKILHEKAPKEKISYQLHHWDYLFCEELTGWVVAKEKEDLTPLASLKNFGGKAGKEGYLFVSNVKEPQELFLKERPFKPLGLVPLKDRCRPKSGVFYNIYGHHWSNNYLWKNGDKGGVDGYVSLGAWWGAENPPGPYWEMDEGVGIPAHAPDAFLTGDVEPFYGDTP